MVQIQQNTPSQAFITLFYTLPLNERLTVVKWFEENKTEITNESLDKDEFLRRKNGLAKFAGALKGYNDYKPNKSEFYEQ